MQQTIHIVDSYDCWPPVEVGQFVHEYDEELRYSSLAVFPIPADDRFPWAEDESVPLFAYNLQSPVTGEVQRQSDHVYVIRQFDGIVRMLAVNADYDFLGSYNGRSAPVLLCNPCGMVWTVGFPTSGVRPEDRPLFRECCNQFMCPACHEASRENLWGCDSCGISHCGSLDSYHCENCGSDTCLEECCSPEYEDDWDGSYEGRSSYRQRNVNTEVRLRGATHEKARGKRFVGVEIEAEGGEGGDLWSEIPRYCGITGDGSLEAGVEIQTPPAKGTQLVEVIEKATDALKSSGWDVSRRCGLHVHIDMTDKREDAQFLARLYAAFYAIEPLLFRLQGGRRDGSTYCVPLRDSFSGGGSYMNRKSVTKIMADWHGVRKYRGETQYDYEFRLRSFMQDKYHRSRYRATNFHSIGCHGTLEIRLHEGTLDSDEILAWVDLLQSVVRSCEDDRWPGGQRLRYAANPVKAQRMFHFTRKTREYLVKRLNTPSTRLSAAERYSMASGNRPEPQPTYAVTSGSLIEVRS